MANYTAPAAKTTNGQLLHTEWNSLTAEAQELSEAMPTKAPAASPTFTGTVTVPDGSFTVGKTTGLQAALDGKAPTTRTITAGTGLTGGGTLASDRTLTVTYGSVAGTAAQGDDPRLSDARTPTEHAPAHAAGGADPLALSAAQITTGLLGLERAPAGAVAHTAATTRPTARTDIMVIFTGPTDPGAAALEGDLWVGAP